MPRYPSELAGTVPLPAEPAVGLAELVASSRAILVAEIVSLRSYWSSTEACILTDTEVAPIQVIKGSVGGGSLTLTEPGGTVEQLTTISLDSADLEPRRSYLLFLSHKGSAGQDSRWRISHSPQGVFEIEAVDGRLRAVSQAARRRLVGRVGDALGEAAGLSGYCLDRLVAIIQELDPARSKGDSGPPPEEGRTATSRGPSPV